MRGLVIQNYTNFGLAIYNSHGNTIAGNWLGSRMAIRVGPAAVRRFLAISLSLLLVTLVWQYFLAPSPK